MAKHRELEGTNRFVLYDTVTTPRNYHEEHTNINTENKFGRFSLSHLQEHVSAVESDHSLSGIETVSSLVKRKIPCSDVKQREFQN